MKHNIKPLLLLAALLLSLCAEAQLSTYNNVSFDLPNLATSKEQAVRTADTSRYIVLGVRDNGWYSFTDINTALGTYIQLVVPDNIHVTHFRLAGDYVIFCGYYNYYTYYRGLAGYFKLQPSYTLGSTEILHYSNTGSASIEDRIDGYHDAATNHLHIMTCSREESITYLDIDLSSSTSSGASYRTNTPVCDVVCTDKYFAAVGIDAHNNLRLYQALKSTLAAAPTTTTLDVATYATGALDQRLCAAKVKGDDIAVSCISEASSTYRNNFYHTISLASANITHSQHITPGTFDQPMELAFVEQPGRMVSIVYHSGLPRFTNCMLCVDPYPTANYAVNEYWKDSCTYESVDATLGSHAVTYGNEHMLFKNILPAPFSAPTSCDTIARRRATVDTLPSKGMSTLNPGLIGPNFITATMETKSVSPTNICTSR